MPTAKTVRHLFSLPFGWAAFPFFMIALVLIWVSNGIEDDDWSGWHDF